MGLVSFPNSLTMLIVMMMQSKSGSPTELKVRLGNLVSQSSRLLTWCSENDDDDDDYDDDDDD